MSQTEKQTKQARPKGLAGWFNPFSGVLLISLAILSILCSRLWWGFELFSHFHVQFACISLFYLPIIWLTAKPTQRIPLLVVQTAGLVYLLFSISHIFVPPKQPVLATHARQSLRVMMANVLSSNQQHDALLRIIHKEQPHVMVLLEVTPGWSRALAPLRKTYPHQLVHPLTNNFGIAVLSRLPVSKWQKKRFSSWGEVSIVADIKVGSKSLRVVGTHPYPPAGGALARVRNQHIRNLADYLQKQKGSTIVAGDFNLTPWSPYYRDFVKEAKLLDSRKGYGLQASWMRSTVVFALPIDHVFTSQDIATTGFRIGPDFGSDHRPLLVDLHVPTR